MSLGQMARGILGPRFFPVVGRGYRAMFVDLQRVCSTLPTLPAGSHLLDVGGGDGALLNYLLRRFEHLSVTMIDIDQKIGWSVEPSLRNRIEILTETTLRQYKAIKNRPVNFVLLCDVMHHIPILEREAFFSELRDVMDPHTSLIIKEVEPGSFRSQLSYLADRYLSGDKHVTLVSRKDLLTLVLRFFPTHQVLETALFESDRPNYCLYFHPANRANGGH